jgi:hypothetical protein
VPADKKFVRFTAKSVTHPDWVVLREWHPSSPEVAAYWNEPLRAIITFWCARHHTCSTRLIFCCSTPQRTSYCRPPVHDAALCDTLTRVSCPGGLCCTITVCSTQCVLGCVQLLLPTPMALADSPASCLCFDCLQEQQPHHWLVRPLQHPSWQGAVGTLEGCHFQAQGPGILPQARPRPAAGNIALLGCGLTGAAAAAAFTQNTSVAAAVARAEKAAHAVGAVIMAVPAALPARHGAQFQ